MMLAKLTQKQLLFVSFFIVFLSLYQTYLKSLSNSQKHLFISSAYRVEEYGRKFVRILAMAENGYNKELICHYPNEASSQKAHTWRIGGYPACKWSAYFIECPQAAETGQEIYVGIENAVKVHKVKLTEVDGVHRRFVVCFARMFTFERWQILIASLHLYKLHGIDLAVIPIASVLREIYELLEEYEKDGFVRLKRAPKLPVFAHFNTNPNAEVEWFNQVLSYNECLYDYRSADFVAFLDVDDVLFPRYHNTLADELDSIARTNPNVASFEFRWGFASAHLSSSPLKYSLTKMIKSTNLVYHLDFGKSVVRPQLVNQAYIHHPESKKEELLYGYKDQMFSNSTFAVHFRNILFDELQVDPTSNTFFANDTKYEQLDNELQEFFRRRPKALEIFRQLPTTLHYYDALSKCYSDYAIEINFSQLTKCPSPIGCLPENTSALLPCIVLDNKYELTQLNDDLQISSVAKSKLMLKPNCLM